MQSRSFANRHFRFNLDFIGGELVLGFTKHGPRMTAGGRVSRGNSCVQFMADGGFARDVELVELGEGGVIGPDELVSRLKAG